LLLKVLGKFSPHGFENPPTKSFPPPTRKNIATARGGKCKQKINVWFPTNKQSVFERKKLWNFKNFFEPVTFAQKSLFLKKHLQTNQLLKQVRY